jgi:uncharacterized membrane protein YeaQ/YmgE (transglycosylase-associated protein family)
MVEKAGKCEMDTVSLAVALYSAACAVLFAVFGYLVWKEHLFGRDVISETNESHLAFKLLFFNLCAGGIGGVVRNVVELVRGTYEGAKKTTEHVLGFFNPIVGAIIGVVACLLVWGLVEAFSGTYNIQLFSRGNKAMHILLAFIGGFYTEVGVKRVAGFVAEKKK